jgi:hypothetical protein
MDDTPNAGTDIDWVSLIVSQYQMADNVRRSHALCEDIERKIEEARGQLDQLKALAKSAGRSD